MAAKIKSGIICDSFISLKAPYLFVTVNLVPPLYQVLNSRYKGNEISIRVANIEFLAIRHVP
jgi:hypothetical protein